MKPTRYWTAIALGVALGGAFLALAMMATKICQFWLEIGV